MDEMTGKKNQLKKQRAPRGRRTQKLMTFRLDEDLADWLDLKPNKGRYINDLIHQDKQRVQG